MVVFPWHVSFLGWVWSGTTCDSTGYHPCILEVVNNVSFKKSCKYHFCDVFNKGCEVQLIHSTTHEPWNPSRNLPNSPAEGTDGCVYHILSAQKNTAGSWVTITGCRRDHTWKMGVSFFEDWPILEALIRLTFNPLAHLGRGLGGVPCLIFV